jgi:hypothetical protein
MSQIASEPRPDLDDVYRFKFNAWPFLPADVPKAWQKPDWTLTAQAMELLLPLLQGEQDQPTILRTAQLALQGVPS